MDLNKDKENLNFINFKKNSNFKLNCNFFCEVRPIDYSFKVGERYQVRQDGIYRFDADLVSMNVLTLGDIINNNYHFLSEGCGKNDFIILMKEAYKKKHGWLEEDTLLHVLFFKKNIQLELF